MIAIDELRLGNWVEMEGYKMVMAIHTRYIQFNDDSDYVVFPIALSHIHPIPLTPEILEKCGFVKDDDGCLKLLNCLYWLDAGILQIAINYAPLINAPCKSLHQLQNLYFALTGEELTVQL